MGRPVRLKSLPSNRPLFSRNLRIAARKSDLARLQAYTVGESLKKAHPPLGLNIEYLFRESLGDKNLTEPLWKAPEKGVFTEDFYKDLCENRCDIVVHSWKDMPILEKEHTFVAATLQREDPRDLLLFKKSHHERVRNRKFLKILSSSPRRAYNLAQFASEFFPYPVDKTDFVAVRGNMQTRLQKLLEQGDCDALIVAKAAWDRLLSTEHMGEPFRTEFSKTCQFIRHSLNLLDWMVLPLSYNPTAAAQGALALEIRRSDEDLAILLQFIDDADSFASVREERETLAQYGGGCHQAIGINILRHEYGKVSFFRGRSESGLEIGMKRGSSQSSQARLDSFHSPGEEKSPSGISLFGKKLRGVNVSKFPGLEVHRLQHHPFQKSGKRINFSSFDGFFIAKQEALPSEWIPESFLKSSFGTPFLGTPLLWTAGLSTWRHLAARGLWVHGSFDGLGENFAHGGRHDSGVEKMGLTHLAPNTRWCKLSHADSDSHLKDFHCYPTYKIEMKISKDKAQHLEEFDHFFWSSGTLFKMALDTFPLLINKIHCCGPGHTAKIIESLLIEKKLDPREHLFVFLSSEQWEQDTLVPPITMG